MPTFTLTGPEAKGAMQSEQDSTEVEDRGETALALMNIVDPLEQCTDCECELCGTSGLSACAAVAGKCCFRAFEAIVLQASSPPYLPYSAP